MLTILNFLNANNLSIFQPILMILVSKFMVHRALSDKTYLLLGLLSPLKVLFLQNCESSKYIAKLFFLSIFYAGLLNECQLPVAQFQ